MKFVGHKGYAFIAPDDGDELSIFAHVKQNPDMEGAQAGDAVTYDTTVDQRPGKKWKQDRFGCIACNVSLQSDLEKAAWTFSRKRSRPAGEKVEAKKMPRKEKVEAKKMPRKNILPEGDSSKIHIDTGLLDNLDRP
jgi:cold shock CspA family protein